MQQIIARQAQKFASSHPKLKPGYTVRVHQRIQEGGKERIQIFEGLIISLHKGRCVTDRSFTVRRFVQGVGVEKLFPLCAPFIEKVEIVRIAPVRRAKLNYMRTRSGKASKLAERFTDQKIDGAKKGEAEEGKSEA